MIFRSRLQSLQKSKKTPQKIIPRISEANISPGQPVSRDSLTSSNRSRSRFKTQYVPKYFNRNCRTWNLSVSLLPSSSYFQSLLHRTLLIRVSVRKTLALFFGGFFWSTTMVKPSKDALRENRLVLLDGRFRLLVDSNSFITKSSPIWTWSLSIIVIRRYHCRRYQWHSLLRMGG